MKPASKNLWRDIALAFFLSQNKYWDHRFRSWWVFNRAR